MRPRVPFVLCFGLICVVAASTAFAVGIDGSYTFTKIADSTGPIGSFNGNVSVNNSGDVAFFGATAQFGIFVGNGNDPVRTLYDSGGSPFGAVGIHPVINDGGVVAFFAALDETGDPEGAFKGDGGTPATIAVEPTMSGFHTCCVSINNAGSVAFRAVQNGHQTVLLDTGSGPVALASTAERFSSVYLDGIDVNGAGTVAFTGQADGARGIYTHDGSTLTVIADDTDPDLDLFGTFSINDDNVVSFRAWVPGGFAILTGDGSSMATVVDSRTNAAFDNVGTNSINDAGDVAFFGVLSGAERGIYRGPDAVADKIVQTGDLVLGSQISAIRGFGGRSLNDSGQIAFIADLTDGTEAVFLATPVPEPTGLLLASLAVPAVAVGIRRRRR